MTLSEPTLASLRGSLTEALHELVESWALRDAAPAPRDSSPLLLEEAFNQLLQAMERTEASLGIAGTEPLRADGDDVSQLCTYALELFEQALAWSRQLNLPEIQLTLHRCLVDVARWTGRHGGEIVILEPVVDALAELANQASDPGELVSIYQAMGEVMDATAAAIRQDLEKNNPGRPWRLLHLNRAIVATRSHRPEIMEQAFAVLIEHLPEDAPRFFSEGMEQMELLNYPPRVREVMNRYYRKWSVSRSLH